MRSTSSMKVLRSTLAISAMFSVGGGCIALYGFDEFEKKPPVSCQTAQDCPESASCGQRACLQGACTVLNPIPAGVFASNQPSGDCKSITCDGKGNEVVAADETDHPVDGNPCTDDVCDNSAPLNPFSAAGTVCGLVDTVTCDGVGACVNCVAAADCGVDTACATWSCDNAVCIRNLQPVGTEAGNAIPGDCKKNYCNVIGDAPEDTATDDAPSDNNPCTADSCTLEGEVVHEASSLGANCGDCLACAVDGSCSPCDPTTSDCYLGTCIPKPQPCTLPSECASNYCVDGFCCDSECGAGCMACSNAKTGAPSGLCKPILDNSDPDNECNTPAADVCFGGKCQCANSLQDGAETGTDCGGTCNVCMGKWNCGGTAACNGAVNPVCCESLCNQCSNQTALCLSLEGQTCALGSANQFVTLGTLFQSGCSNSTACKLTTCKCL